MLARVQSYLLSGIDALPCEVEVDVDEGAVGGPDKKPLIVGLPDAGVKEAMERVRSAVGNSGYAFPLGRILINLAPADVRKEGPVYDLPIAVGLLVCQGVVRGAAPMHVHDRSHLRTPPANLAGPREGLDLRRFILGGELALDGRVRPIKGVIALAALAKARGAHGVIIPAENAAEAAVVPGIEVLGVRSLAEVVGLLNGQIEPTPQPPLDVDQMLRTAEAPVDFAEVRGQEAVKRAIVIGAAGGHNLFRL